MKAMQIAVLLVVLYCSTLEALQCHQCEFTTEGCENQPQQCEPDQICTVVIQHFPKFSITKGCQAPRDPAATREQFKDVFQCSTDFCNH